MRHEKAPPPLVHPSIWSTAGQRYRLVSLQGGVAEFTADEAGPWVSAIDHLRVVGMLAHLVDVMRRSDADEYGSEPLLTSHEWAAALDAASALVRAYPQPALEGRTP